MIVMLNGSFGVGKSTVANLLCRAWPGSAVYDPELAGSILMRLPKWIKLEGSGTDDFQDLALWRRSAVAGVKLCHRFASGPVIVPMAFTDHHHFNEIFTGLSRFDPYIKVFCLMASLATVRERLLSRGTQLEGSGSEWIAGRIVECAEAHRDPHFGEPIHTEGRSAAEVAEDILGRLRVDWPATAVNADKS